MNKINSQITNFIYNHPDIAANLLAKFGYSVKKPLTLTSINEAMFTAVYGPVNLPFLNELERAIVSDGYSNFILTAITVGMSIVSSILASQEAKKQRALQEKLALANLATQQLLGEADIRTTAETKRTEIIANTLLSYRKDLQGQSTQRLKDVWVYVGMLGVSIAIIYGTSILLTQKA